MFGGTAQSEKRPASGENERVAIDAVDAGVAAVPAAAGAHAVIEKADGQSAAFLQFHGEGFGELGTEPRFRR